VRCRLEAFVYGSELIGIAITLPHAAVPPSPHFGWIVFLGDPTAKSV